MPRLEAPVPYVSLPARLAVLLSGRGSNSDAIAEACARGELPAEVAVVVSDREDAPGLARAASRGLVAVAVPRRPGEGRDAHEERLLGAIEDARADLVCLAGFMRVLSPRFVARFPLRILNIHPSLLPSFPGKDAQAQAIAYGVKVSGATVHFVDAGVDSGPVIVQEAVPVLPGDDAAALGARILRLEHRLYVAALGVVLRGGWVLDGRSVTVPG